MPNKLIRLAGQVFNTPQLITETHFQPIVSYLRNRNNGSILGDTIYQGTPGPGLATEELDVFNGVGVLKIQGSLTYKPMGDWMCAPESTSYLDLIEDTQELIDAGVKAIIYEVSSGGGMASHAFDCADTLRQMLTDAGVASYAYVDEMSASAAYLLSCVFDEVIIHPEAQAGSIGAVICLIDDSKAMDEAGYKEIFITSTPGKVPFDSNGAFKESFLNKLQADVTRLGDEFCQHVSKYTGVPVEEIKALDAQMFSAEDALQKGLVNSIMNHREFSNYIASKYQ